MNILDSPKIGYHTYVIILDVLLHQYPEMISPASSPANLYREAFAKPTHVVITIQCSTIEAFLVSPKVLQDSITRVPFLQSYPPQRVIYFQRLAQSASVVAH